MIDKRLDSVLKDMASYHKQLEEKDDVEKKARNDHNYNEKVSEVSLQIKKIGQAKKQLKFKPDDSVLNDFEIIVGELENCVSLGMVNEEDLSRVTSKINSANTSLSSGWSNYYNKQIIVEFGRADLLTGLVDKKEKYINIKKQMEAASNWSNLHLPTEKGKTRLDQFSEGITEIEKAMDNLNLNPQITQFLTKVNDGKATIDDLNDEVIKWIKDQKFNKIFRIRFGS